MVNQLPPRPPPPRVPAPILTRKPTRARLRNCADSLRRAHTNVDLQVVGLESLQRESTADQWYGRQQDINDRVRYLLRLQPILLRDTAFCISW